MSIVFLSWREQFSGKKTKINDQINLKKNVNLVYKVTAEHSHKNKLKRT